MKIDTHLHLNYKKHKYLDKSFSALSNELNHSEIEKAVVIHMLDEPWSVSDFSNEIHKYNNLIGVLNVDPTNPASSKIANDAIEVYDYKGIKLHPRLQNYDLDDKKVYDFVKSISHYKIPIIIDAFPDGTFLMEGFSPLKYARLAKAFPDLNFVWAHMGGFKAIEFMMLSKRLDNVFFDISYSFLYFRESSLLKDMIYCFKSLKFEKIFYGSDYPDRGVYETLKLTQELISQFEIEDYEIEKLFYYNAKKFWFE